MRMRFDPTDPVIASAYWYASDHGALLEYIEPVGDDGRPTERYIEVDPPVRLTPEQAARTLPTWEEETILCPIRIR